MFKEMEKVGLEEDVINTVKWLYRETGIKVGDSKIGIGAGVI